MHDPFFGLNSRPFLSVPTLDRYCPIPCQESAFSSAKRVIQRGDGPIAIIGGTGLGKSMVCLRIADSFRHAYEIILLSSSQICSRRALLQNLLFELRMPYRDHNEGTLRLSLLERLQSNEFPSDGFILIVDEAQTLSLKLLDELRMLTNLAQDGVPRIRLVLCGTLRLEEMLSHPSMESLNQRIAERAYLTPLLSDETVQYISRKVELSGAKALSVFSDAAMRLIHRATDGIPRLIDQLADRCLIVASESRTKPISESIVETAWASLQQLPLPWSDTPSSIQTAPAPSVIEFGSLDDEPETEFESTATPEIELNQVQLESAYQRINAYEPVEFFQPIESDESVGPSDRITEDCNQDRFCSIPPQAPSAGMGLAKVSASALKRAEPAVEKTTAYSLPAGTPVQEVSVPTNPDEVFGSDFEEEMYIGTSLPVPAVSAMPTAPGVPLGEAALQDQADSVPLANTLPSNFNDNSTTISEPRFQHLDDMGIVIEEASDEEIESFLDRWSGRASNEFLDVLENISTNNMEAMTFDTAESFFRPIETAPEPSYAQELNWQGPIDAIQPNATLPGEDQTPVAKVDYPLEQPVTESTPVRSVQPQPNQDVIPSQVHQELGGYNHSKSSEILSFYDLQQDSPRSLIGDDRDLLMIEEDIASLSQQIAETKPEPVEIHPYKQLFSKLRG